MKKVKIIFIGIFLCMISGFGVATLDNKVPKSDTEGRTLKQFPDLDFRRFKDTVYLSAISDACADQIAKREKLISMYYDFMVNKLHQTYVGTVVIGEDCQLFQEPELITDDKAYKKQIVKTAKLINKEAEEITKNGAKFIYINYPKKDVVEREYLPSYYPDSQSQYEEYVTLMQENLSKDVIFLDAYEIFKESPENDYYYKTDHHVNEKGQQLIYEQVMSIVKEDYPTLQVKTLQDYKVEKRKINGSYLRKLGFVLDVPKEDLVLSPKGWELNYTTKTNGAPVFGEGDTYASAFMGADYAYTQIETDNDDGPDVLICGSSYTNALEALSLASVHRLVSVDFRYNKEEKDLADYAKEEKVQYVIYIPNQSDKMFDYETFKQHIGK